MLRIKDLKFLDWIDAGAVLFSTCSKRQCMALIVGTDGRVVGTGYNGSPPGMPHCTDGACPRLHNNSPAGSDYADCIATHAEANCLMYSDRSLRAGGTLYVTGTPCYPCAKLIASSGISRVVTRNDQTFEAWPKVKSFLFEAGLVIDEVFSEPVGQGIGDQRSTDLSVA